MSEPTGNILVTGGGGFIGGRMVELLRHLDGVTAHAGIRRWASAVRVGRFAVPLTQCDIMDVASTRAAIEPMDYVVHCAVGDRDTTVEGTRNVLQAAKDAGTKRVVYLSTVDVYGPGDGRFDETASPNPDNPYGKMKVEAEAVCREFADKGLEVVTLRPTLVHGPFSETWTLEFVRRLLAGPWFIPEETAGGTCNLVYVDDLVLATRRALVAEGVSGEAFNVNGPERPTWSAYFSALNDAMGLPELRPASQATSKMSAGAMLPVRKLAKAALNQFEAPIMGLYKKSEAARKVMKIAERAIKQTPTPGEFKMYSRDVDFVGTKAEEKLGYQPAYGMKEALEVTGAWLRLHGFVS